jgi:hypothetical protein
MYHYVNSNAHMLFTLARGAICCACGSIWTFTEDRSGTLGTLENFIHSEVIEIEIDRFYFSIALLHSQHNNQQYLLIMPI